MKKILTFVLTTAMVLSLASSAMAAPSPTVRDEDIVHNGSPQYMAYNDATRDGKKAELRQLGKFCYEQFIANEENMDRFMDGVNKLAEDVKDDGVKTTVILAPTSAGMLSPRYQDWSGSEDEGAAAEAMSEKAADGVQFINMLPVIKGIHKEKTPLFFYTAPYWNPDGAYVAYRNYCEKNGLTTFEQDELSRLEEGEYRGPYYAFAADYKMLGKDEMSPFVPKGNFKVESNGSEYNNPIVDFSDKANEKKYGTFLGDETGTVKITNLDAAEDGDTCLIIKDSFGNPFAAYLSQNYRTIYVIDFRTFEGSIREFVQENKVDVIIICTGIESVQGTDFAEMLEK